MSTGTGVAHQRGGPTAGPGRFRSWKSQATAALSLVGISALLASVAGGGIAGAQPSGAEATDSELSVNCAPFMAYLVPGTGETTADADPSEPVGLLADVGERLDTEFGEDINVVYVPYEASAFDKGLTYQASQATGVAATAELIASCPDSEIVIAGYSQGADVAGDIAWHIGQDDAPIAADKVRGVALMADPKSGTRALVGTRRTGEGISGDRPGGFGQLDRRVKSICSPEDMYCNVRSDNPMAKVLGELLGSGGGERESVTPLDGVFATEEDPEVAQLVSDFSNVDLVGAKSKATDLRTRTNALADSDAEPTAAQLEEIVRLATDLRDTYGAVGDVNDFATESGARSILDAEKEGTPGAKTAQVLEVVDTTDMDELIAESEQIIDTASGLVSQISDAGDTVADATSGTGGRDQAAALTEGGELLKSMALQAAELAEDSGALNDLERSNLTAATGVLSTLKVSSVVDTSLMAMTVTMSTDYEGINANLAKMGELIMAGDHAGVHDVSQELLYQLEPWVDFVDAANSEITPMAASMVTATPDPTGQAAMTGMAMQVLGQLDVKAVWNVARKAHDISGDIGEGRPEALGEQLPALLVDLANVSLGALTGSDSGLGGASANRGGAQAEVGAGAAPSGNGGAPATGGGTAGGTGGTGDSEVSDMGAETGTNPTEDVAAGLIDDDGLSGLVEDLGGIQDLSALMQDGLDYAAFLNSGVHTSDYTNRTLVGSMSAVDYIGEYFTVQLAGDDEQEEKSSQSNSESDRGSSGRESRSDRGQSSQSSERGSRSSGRDDNSRVRTEHIRHRNGGISPDVMQAVEPLVANAGPTRVSVSMADVSGGDMRTVGDSPNTYAASTVKVAIAAAVVEKIGADKLNDVMIPVTEITGGANKVTSTGEYSAAELVAWMITESCNTSTNALIDYLGGFAPVNEMIEDAGVEGGYTLANKMMTTQDSVLSSDGGTQFLQALYRAAAGQGRWISAPAAEVVVEMMAQQKNRTKLSRNLPDEAVYSKTGENSGVSHDMGYIVKGDRVYAVTVTTTGQTNDALIGQIGQAIHTNMGERS